MIYLIAPATVVMSIVTRHVQFAMTVRTRTWFRITNVHCVLLANIQIRLYPSRLVMKQQPENRAVQVSIFQLLQQVWYHVRIVPLVNTVLVVCIQFHRDLSLMILARAFVMLRSVFGVDLQELQYPPSPNRRMTVPVSLGATLTSPPQCGDCYILNLTVQNAQKTRSSLQLASRVVLHAL